jgi:hypothetical protein
MLRTHFGAIAMFVLLAACSKAPEPVATAPAERTVAATPPPATMTKPDPCPATAPCGDSCSNTPYVQNDCWTTLHGPAADNVVISASGDPQQSTNMLLCDSGPYALCFFSGPPVATGKIDPNGSNDNNALPCTLDESGTVANCSCQYYGSGISFVDINGIINQNAYYETVQQCGHDGAGCANMQACGSGPGVSTKRCGMPEAKVCSYVRNQTATPPAGQPDPSLVPGYDVISTFSLAMAADYDMKSSVNCEGDYLGCMTAPCSFPDGVEQPEDASIVTCQCPVASGVYQIGQAAGPNVACSIPSDGAANYLWSAARTVKHGDPKENAETP